MRPAAAIAELERLTSEADNPLGLRPTQHIRSWKARVCAVLARSIGEDSDIVKRFDAVRYHPSMWSDASPDSYFEAAFVRGIRAAVGLIEGAVYELGLIGGDEPVDEHAYDPDLWAHVKTQVEDEECGKVAALTAIFVENQVRTWAGHPKEKTGSELVGKALYLEVFAEASDYRLGRQAGERERWPLPRDGFAQALGNVDRHRIQRRDDAKRYAPRGARARQPDPHPDALRARRHSEKRLRTGVDSMDRPSIGLPTRAAT